MYIAVLFADEPFQKDSEYANLNTNLTDAEKGQVNCVF